MSVYKRPDSPWYHYDFQWRGRRFSGTTKAGDRRTAEAFERAERKRVERAAEEEARAPAQDDPTRLTFGAATAIYQDAIGEYRKGLSLNANQASPLFGLGEAYRGLGDRSHAAQYYQECASSSAPDAASLRDLAHRRYADLLH